MVDLRCHGETAARGSSVGEPNNVMTSAKDVLSLLSQLRLFPQVLAGHSYGGKVVMSMAEQFSSLTSHLPRPVQVRAFCNHPERVPLWLPSIWVLIEQATQEGLLQ